MMSTSDLYRISRQAQEDRLQGLLRQRQLREARETEPGLRERLRHLYGMLMTILA